MKKLFRFGVGMALVGSLMACGDDDSNDMVVDKEVAATNLTENSENSFGGTAAQKVKEQDILVGLEEATATFAVTTFSEAEKTYILLPYDEGFIDELIDYASYGIGADEWFDFVDSVVNLSNTIEGELGSGYSIIMFNPHDTNKVLLEVKDGEVLYSM